MKNILLVLLLSLFMSSNAFAVKAVTPTDDSGRSLWQSPITSFTTLATPGLTAAVSVINYNDHTFQVTVANVSLNVVVDVQGTLDDSNYFTVTGSTNTYTADGTYGIILSDIKCKSFKFKFVSASGAGTTPTMDVLYLGGNF